MTVALPAGQIYDPMVEQSGPVQIAAALGDLAFEMQSQTDPEQTLRSIVSAAVRIIPGISWAGVSLVRGGKVTPGVPTDDVARILDKAQSQLGEGPAIDALAEEHTIVIQDLDAEIRWPRFIEAARGNGVGSMVSFRLFVTRQTLGALSLYGAEAGQISDDTILYGEILAQHAAVAIAGAQAENQLQVAVASRDVIGQAKGIIMERHHVTALKAFGMLTQLSQESNTKLVEVAKQVIATAEVS